jgi:protein SCO1/2
MTTGTIPATFSRRRSVVLGTLIGVGAAVLLGALAWSVSRYGSGGGADLPVLGAVPNFSLIGSDGRPVSQVELTGKVWVADFIFTRCPGMCPVLSAQMARVQEALSHQPASSVRLVSFSVDPSNDTPEALRAYAERFRAEAGRWLFLTGERDALDRLIQDGFHLAVAQRSEAESSDGEGLITHSDRFVLVDAALRIRGYYHGMDDQDIQRLLRDIDTLQSDG